MPQPAVTGAVACAPGRGPACRRALGDALAARRRSIDAAYALPARSTVGRAALAPTAAFGPRARARLRDRRAAPARGAPEAPRRARMPPLFLILDRNREWWSKAGPPASGRAPSLRLQPGDLPVLPRARACSSSRSPTSGRRTATGTRTATAAICARWSTTSSTLRVSRGGFTHLGVLLRLRRRLAALDLRDGAGHGDAGARARERSGSPIPRCCEVASAARGAFERRTPIGRPRAAGLTATGTRSTASRRA